jgi:integrase
MEESHPVQANRLIALLSRLFGVAVKLEMRESNPAKGLEKAKRKERPRERILKVPELAALGLAIRELRKSDKANPVLTDAIAFLCFTGLRLSEALNLRWEQIDLENRSMRIAEHKADGAIGTKVLPLNHQASQILRARAGQKVSPWVFPGHKIGGRLVNLEKPWRAIRSKAGELAKREAEKIGRPDPEIDLSDVRLHDFRRTFGSTVFELTALPALEDALLGHSAGRVRDSYTVLDASGILAQTSRATGDWLEAALEGRSPKPGVRVGSESSASTKG